MTANDRILNDFIKDNNPHGFLFEYCRQYGLDPNDPNDSAKVSAAWNTLKNMSLKVKTDSSPSDLHSGSNRPTSIPDFLRKAVQTQSAENKGMMGGEFQTVESIANLFLTADNKLKSIRQFFGDFAKDVGQQVILYFEQQNDLLEKMNQKTGILGGLSKGFRHEITEASIPAVKLGISFTELSDVITDVTAKSGKMKLLDDETISRMALVSKFAESLSEYSNLVPIFEKIGLGVGDMNREIEKAGMSSMGLGLNARKTVSLIAENLDKLNTYGFQKGVQGITEMAQKAVQFRMDMNKAFVLADKVWSPDGALEVVSNLQVIGGAFGDLNDPIKLMYMATNNVEGLQDAIIGASKSLVTFNQEQGRFQVTGANLRRAKEMADQFGMSMQELTTGAIAAMERTQAATDLMSRGLNLKPEQTEFLTNLARMEGGKMVISIPENLRTQLGLEGQQKNIALESLSQAQAERLIIEQDELKKKTMEDIAVEQVSLIENINRDLSFLVATARVKAGEVGNNLVRALGWDPVKVAIEAAQLSNKASKFMVDVSDKAMSKMFGGTGAVFANDKEKQTGKLEGPATNQVINTTTRKEVPTTEPEKTTKIVHEHRFSFTTGDNALDTVKREMMTDPKFVKDVQNGFLETIPKN